jgi:hypothetical protein
MQKARVGYEHTTIHAIARDGRPLLRIDGLNHLVTKRANERVEQEFRSTEFDTLDGQLLEFEYEMTAGGMKIAGRAAADQFLLTVTTAGKTTTSALPRPADCGGFCAVNLSLERQPLQPGQKRTLTALMAGINKVATIELAARDFQRVTLPSGSYDLLAIDARTRFADGQSIMATLWTDRTGQIIKNRSDEMNLESIRADKVSALEETDGGQLDLMSDLAVKIDKPLVRAHASRRIRYRVHLEGGDPASVFVSGPSQQLRSIDPHTAEITVVALRPGDFPPGTPKADETAEADDLQPNNLIQSDDARVVAMAREAAGAETDPWKTALLLERYVNRIITKKDFAHAFTSAAEVAAHPEGDCTEHAVLLAALARARGIPARVAVGLVYVEASQSFGYHMWDEVFIGKHWIPIDATLALGGIGGAHLKLAHSNLQGGSAYASFLPVMKVSGRLKIEVLEEQ